jgi:hypothetical protein
MAIRTFRGTTNSNWGVSTNWLEGSVPLITDDVIFDASSPSCIVDSITRICQSIVFSTYTNTITMTASLQINGSITLGTGMTINGTGGIAISANSTLTSNGKYWPTQLAFSSGTTYTLADNWTVNNLYLVSNGSLNGFTIYTLSVTTANGDLDGTTNIVFNGTGTWSGGGGYLRLNVEINTTGTVTFGSTIFYYKGTLLYTTGTVITTGNTFYAGSGVSTILNTKGSSSPSATTTSSTGINFYNLIIGVSTPTTLLSPICIIGNLNVTGVVNGSTAYINGDLSGGGGNAVGGTTYIMQGTGSVKTNTVIEHDLTINTTGTITFVGTITFYYKTLTYISGTVITTGSTLIHSGNTTCTFDTKGSSSSSATTTSSTGINWNNVSQPGIGSQTTLLSNFCVLGTLSMSGVYLGLYNIYAQNNLTITGSSTNIGTSTIIMNGTGTWSGSFVLFNNLIFNTTGTVTVSGVVYFNNGTITYTSGTMVTTGSILIFPANTSVTINTSGMYWDGVRQANGTLTLLSNLNMTGDFIHGSNGTSTMIGFSIFVGGNMTGNSGTSGTSDIVMTGTGTVLGSYVPNDLILNSTGIITIYGIGVRNLIYISGTIICSLGVIRIQNPTLPLDYNGKITFTNVSFNGGTFNLLSDVTLLGNFYCGAGGSVSINGPYKVYIGGDLTAPGSPIGGSSTLVLNGTGTWTYGHGINVTIDTTSIIIIDNIIMSNGAIYTYIKGKISTNNSTTLSVNSSCTFIGYDKMSINNVIIAGGIVVNTDKFFGGTSNSKVIVNSSNSTNYSINFISNTIIFCKFAKISNCNLLQPGRLISITKDTDGENNNGIIFGNKLPNGFTNNISKSTNDIVGFVDPKPMGFI